MSDDPNAVPPPRNDNATPRAEAMAHAFVANLVGGLRFYSRLPIGFVPHTAPELNRIAPVLPLVSLLLGLGPAVLMVVLTLCGLPSVYAAGIAVAVSLVLTGAMAEDALADACDGLFGGTTPERRLEIMRDSRIGTYGTLALILVTLGRWSALSFLMATGHILAPLIAAAVLSRGALPVMIHALPHARRDGMAVAAGVPPRETVLLGLGVAAAIAVVMTGWAVVATVLAVAAAALLVGLVARAKIGGQTGDILGAAQQTGELAALATLCATI